MKSLRLGLTLRHLFTPHYTNNHRPRILHPMGLTVLIFIFLVSEVWIQMLRYSPLPQGMVLGYASSITADEIINLTNGERLKAGLPTLAHNALLSQAATAKASDMFTNNYWAHIAPNGTTPWYFIKNAGYDYAVAGENLARDFADSQSVVTAWMNSPTHKENVVNPKYTEIGVAVVNGTLQGLETTLVVQMFGKPTKALAQTSTSGMSTNRVPKAAPVALVLPTQNPTPTPMTLAQNSHQQLGVTLTEDKQGSTLPFLVSPLTLTKAVATSIILLLIVVLMYDELMMQKHKIPRRVGKNWAHLTIFGIILMVVVALTQGKIL